MMLSPLRAASVAAVAVLLTAGTIARGAPDGTLRVTHAYARPVPAGAVGAAYLEIENPSSTADRLLSLSSTVGTAELHEMKMDGDVMRMRKIASLEIPAHATIRFAPGGFHVMLTHLEHPLAADEHFRLRLQFERAGEVDVDVPVEQR